MKKILLLLMVLMFVVSCSKGGNAKGSYILKVNNITISKDDVRDEWFSLPENARQFFSGPDGTTRLVDELAKKEMLYLEAKKQGLDKNKDFEKRVEEFKKINLVNQLLENEMEKTTKSTDKDAQAYYDSHKNEFVTRNAVKLYHILLKDKDSAKKAYDRLANGADFGKLAEAVSIDKNSAKAGGLMGTFKKGDLDPDFADSVFALRDGENSAPVKSKYGYHIFKVESVKGPATKFEEVKDLIIRRLDGEKQKAAFDKYMEKLKKSYTVDINRAEIIRMSASPLGEGGERAPAPAPAPAPRSLPKK